MKENWVKLKEWWINLTASEKKTILLGGAVISIVIIYLWIWSPLVDAVVNKRNRILADEKLLVWMQMADKEIQNSARQRKSKSALLSPVALLSYMQNKVTHASLNRQLTQLKQLNNDSITMQFQKVEFDKMALLLMDIVKEQNVSIVQLSVIAEKSPGTVTTDVVIKLR